MQLVGQRGPLTGMVFFLDFTVCVSDLIYKYGNMMNCISRGNYLLNY